jgi:Immunity protein Imm1
MLIMWRPLGHVDEAELHIDAPDALDALLDRLHRQAIADDYPHAAFIYAGEHYPEIGHAENGSWIPATPGDGKQPELLLTVGTEQSPVYWTDPADNQHISQGPAGSDHPELEYFSGGQETYAPAWSLVPTGQAREAARQFVASGGQRPANVTWRTG